ncbi:MAG: hypothetical protein AAF512_08105 [Pseudomonadota bacterium]
MKPEEIHKVLRTAEPENVRRVLPHDFITAYIKRYLLEMETMMKSFQAILTFPTSGRQLPQEVMQRMRKQFSQDLSSNTKKTNGEVTSLLAGVKNGKVLQSHVMLKVISDQPFPFCVLNTWEFQIDEHNFIPCYVNLWAQQPKEDQPIYVWLQLDPKNPMDIARLPPDQRRTERKIIRLPTGQADFNEFGTMISVMLHDVPSQAEARLQGKSLTDMIQELRDLRESLLRQKGQRGNFLHFIWSAHQQATPRYVPIHGFEIDSEHNSQHNQA